ncbi:MAG: response regulator, partial [Gammaproteobacteria bacterium]|nr:response regulator [Gammaproteobacteria bacterium]
DDDINICSSLCYLLKSIHIESKYYIDSNQFLKNINSETYECLLIDVRMPNVNGLIIAQQLQRNGINTPYIFITGYPDIKVAVEAMKDGAYDFITKPIESKRVVKLILEAMQLNQSRQMKHDKTHDIKKRINQLSNREKQILEYVTLGKKSQEISDEIHISLKTVESHRYRILKKMQVSSTIHLISLLSQMDEWR